MDLNWDDLRYFLALYRHGSLSAAARALDVTHATVGRRIEGLQQNIGAVLFEKTGTGWEVTDFGRSLVAPAEAAEEAHLAVERRIRSQDAEQSGVVRIASSQLLARYLVIPFARDLRTNAPHTRLDLVEGVELVSLPRREADLGLRMWRAGKVPGADSVRCTRLGSFAWRMFGAPALVDELGVEPPVECLDGLPLITYDTRAPYVPGTDWIQQRTSARPNYVFSSNSMYSVNEAVVAGLGFGILPDVLGATGNLVPVSDGELLEQHVWLAIHPDMDRNARIRGVYDALVEYARETSPIFDDLDAPAASD